MNIGPEIILLKRKIVDENLRIRPEQNLEKFEKN
jgi:hypothetical protein